MKKENYKNVGASVLSLLSGNPSGRDKQYHHIKALIDNARYEQSIQAFSIACDKVREGKEPYQTMWVKSPHGVYAFVRTQLPININGEFEPVPGYAVLFSQHPSFLARWLLDNGKKNDSSLKEINAKVSVITARYHHDILQTNKKTGKEYLVTTWVKDGIDRHTKTFGRMLKRHGSIIKDNNNIYRSGSSVFWTEKSKEDPSKVNCHYYGNPDFGQTSLYMDEKTLESPTSSSLFKKASLKLNKSPLTDSQAHDLIHQKFSQIARSIVRNEDPYDLDKPDDFVEKTELLFKKKVLRGVQGGMHAAANTDYKSAGITLLITGAFAMVLNLPLLLAAATSSARSNLIMKIGTPVAKAVKGFLSPQEKTEVNASNDVAPLLGDFVPNNKVSDEMRGLILNPKYMKYMRAMPVQYMGNTFPDIKEFTAESSESWARGLTRDSLGIQPGTIFQETEIQGQMYLKAEQPNGLNVYYNSEASVAIAHQVREPYEHTCMEKPIQELMSDLPEGHKFVGIRKKSNGELKKITFSSLENIPEELTKSKMVSIQDLEEQGISLNDLDPTERFNMNSVLPEATAKKRTKAAEKEIKIQCKAAIRGDFICASPYRQVTTHDKLYEVYGGMDDFSEYAKRVANPDGDNRLSCIYHR